MKGKELGSKDKEGDSEEEGQTGGKGCGGCGLSSVALPACLRSPLPQLQSARLACPCAVNTGRSQDVRVVFPFLVTAEFT